MREVGEDDESAGAAGAELLLHLDEDRDEVSVENCEVRSALVHRKRGEPPEQGWAGARIRIGGAASGFGVVERDVGGEGVEELLSRIHRNIWRRKLFRCGGCWWPSEEAAIINLEMGKPKTLEVCINGSFVIKKQKKNGFLIFK